MKLNGLHSPLFLFIMSEVIIAIIICQCFKSYKWMSLVIISTFMMTYFLYHPMHRQLQDVLGKQRMVAQIKEVTHTAYNTRYILDDISIVEQSENVKIHFKMQGEAEKSSNYRVGDQVIISGLVEELPIAYNPSDMDYGLYLKGEGVAAIVKIQQITKIRESINIVENLRIVTGEYIDKLFKLRDKGIVKSLILGDAIDLDISIRELYNSLGIGHVLAISGLHVGIIYTILWWITGKLKYRYVTRNMLIGIILWGYCIVTGLSTSAVRATIIITFLLSAKILWEEIDFWTVIGWASLGMTLINPYIIFQVGFQLSYTACIAIGTWNLVVKACKYQYKIDKRWMRMIQVFGASIWISIWISPILAYHFYKVPLIASLFNIAILILIQLFIPLIIIALVLGGVSFFAAYHLAGGICLILSGIEWIGRCILQMPFATIVIGRPESVEIIIYYSALIGIMYVFVYKIHISDIKWLVGISVGMLFVLSGVNNRAYLRITHLYVGQGDSTVMITPEEQVIVIDGGAKGKGKTVERFIQYNGLNKVDLAIITHAHEDHIAGIIELIENDVEIRQVCMPYTAEGEWVNRLEKLCREKNIPLWAPIKGSSVAVDKVDITFFAPEVDYRSDDVNELSAVALVEYGAFDGLYTGDLPMERERYFYNEVGDIDVLKVGHHGSSTSTSEKLLEQTLPEYGMISCGKNNRYKHPSPLVIERLEDHGVKVLKTYEQGAITIQTDGENLKIATHL